MALYPIKVLLDKDRNVFIPFLPANAIPINGTDETVAGALENRYTKNEVDNIIKSLGTLQVLRGRVNTYEDLLTIENPQAGDVYIVGTSDTENSEYMYIGNTWERLGPMVDLTVYYTKTEVDTKIAEIPAPDLSDYTTKRYVDNKVNDLNTQLTALDNKVNNLNTKYYNKIEVDAMIREINRQLQYVPTPEDIDSLSAILGEDASTVEYNSSNAYVSDRLDGIIESSQYVPTSQDVSNLGDILGEDASTVEYTSADSEVNTKLNNIIGGI